MIDKRALYNDLVEQFIHYQWRLDNPMPQPTETRAIRIDRYRRDPVFHAKVNSLVSAVMVLVSQHDKTV